MRPGDIKLGDHILFKSKYSSYYDNGPFEGRVIKIAGDRFQVRRWNPLNKFWHQWLEMEDYVLIGRVTSATEPPVATPGSIAESRRV